jgi:hypothetical protein
MWIRLFWAWFVLTSILSAVVPQGRIFLGAIALGYFWLAMVYFRDPLRRFVARWPLTERQRFFIIGLICSNLLMENFAVNFKGDLDPNLLKNMFWWLGMCLAWVTGWWILSQYHSYTPNQVFFIAGLMGLCIEQNWMAPRLLLTGQWFPLLASAPILVATYGFAVAPPFLISPGEGALSRRPAGKGAVVFAFVMNFVFAYAGSAVWLGWVRPVLTRTEPVL